MSERRGREREWGNRLPDERVACGVQSQDPEIMA